MTRGLCAGLPVAAVLLLAAPPFVPSAKAQLLPDTGTTVQVGALRQQLEGLLNTGTSTPATPGWTIAPALGAEERWTDHLLTVDGTGKSSFATALLPSVLINGQTERTTTTINYAPELTYYSDGNQNQISQNLDAFSKITVLPEHLFLDLHGFAAVQPTYGGYGPVGTAAVAKQDETQTLSFSAHPYLRQSFRDLGVAELGTTLSRASQNGLAGSLSSGQPTPIAAVPAQNLTSEQEYFSLTSGPAFGRTNADLELSANQDTGSGVLSNARQDEAVVNLGYSVTRSVTALTSFGYDDIHYAGTPPFNYSGPRWSVGARWIPNPDSSITVNYGRQEGVESAQIDANYALTARTRVYARYSEGITSGLQQVLNGVNGSTLDATGNLVASNGTPMQANNGFYGVQNNLERVTDTSVTVTTLRDRDAISLTLSYQQSHQLAAASATSAGGSQNSTGWYGTLTWQRSLWPDLNASAFVQWGTNQYTPAGSGQNFNTLVFSLNLNYVISRTVTAYAQYSWTRQTYSGSAGSVLALPANLIVIGARKTF